MFSDSVLLIQNSHFEVLEKHMSLHYQVTCVSRRYHKILFFYFSVSIACSFWRSVMDKGQHFDISFGLPVRCSWNNKMVRIDKQTQKFDSDSFYRAKDFEVALVVLKVLFVFQLWMTNCLRAKKSGQFLLNSVHIYQLSWV